MSKTDYHTIAEYIRADEISEEIIDVLEQIHSVASE